MAAPKTVAEARKQMQTARLKKKGSKDYPEFYANQPVQLVKAQANAQLAGAKAALKAANETLAIAEITGEGLEEASKAQAIAALVVQKATPASSGASASLSGA